MAFQDYPWNNDGYLAAEVLRLKESHGLTRAIETGTCLGSTTLWLAEHFDEVYTVEIHKPSLDIASARFNGRTNIHAFHGQSALMLRNNAPHGLYFLDAHWGNVCPLIDELFAIASHGTKPCIIIHDFQVPGTDFGFDLMPDGTPFNLALIAPYLDAIYGPGGWTHNYPAKVEGARRGWISVEPT